MDHLKPPPPAPLSPAKWSGHGSGAARELREALHDGVEHPRDALAAATAELHAAAAELAAARKEESRVRAFVGYNLTRGLRRSLRRLSRGDLVVVDDAFGASVAAGVLLETKRLLAAGRMHFEAPRHYAPDMPSAMADAMYAANPGFWDSLRLTRWLAAADAEAEGLPALAHAIHSLEGLHAALGAAEVSLTSPLSPAWPPSGLQRDPTGALLSVSGFNGTRYALHADASVAQQRKLAAIWYPRTEPAWQPGDGGELRVETGTAVSGGGKKGDGGPSEPRATMVSPRADRLVLFHAELAHEVLPMRERGPARLSLSSWGLAPPDAARLLPPNARVDLSSARCSSSMCRAGLRRAGGPRSQLHDGLWPSGEG